MLLRLVNFFTGERHAYATLAVQSLMQAGTSVQFWWYDIACRWSKSYHKWLAQQDPAVRAAGAAMQFLIPPWHVYAHRSGASRLMGWGCSGVPSSLRAFLFSSVPSHCPRPAKFASSAR